VNICGPMSAPSIKSSKYYVIFKGDYYGFCFVYYVVIKPKVFWCFKDFYHQIYRYTVEIVLAHCKQIEVASFLKNNFKHFYSMKEFITILLHHTHQSKMDVLNKIVTLLWDVFPLWCIQQDLISNFGLKQHIL